MKRAVQLRVHEVWARLAAFATVLSAALRCRLSVEGAQRRSPGRQGGAIKPLTVATDSYVLLGHEGDR